MTKNAPNSGVTATQESSAGAQAKAVERPSDQELDQCDRENARRATQGVTTTASSAVGSASVAQAKTRRVSGAPHPPMAQSTASQDTRNADRVPRAPEGPVRGSMGPTSAPSTPEPRTRNKPLRNE